MLDLPSVPESVLAAEVAARLPASTPGPPWHCRVRAVVWLQRATAPGVDGATGTTMGAVVDYLDSPVGAYREVFAGPLLRHAGLPTVHVPFIAVDSVPSVHGGRAHWGLPKALASFTGDVGAGRVRAEGEGWSVGVEARTAGLPVPLVGTFANRQAAGRARVSLRGRGRLARVGVDALGPTLAGWLGSGTHPGVVGTGRLVVHPPQA
ncbi:MAG TPA: acetoacetate decarboxylase family protein [Mycobacteriales bacterium]|nr:acetoacetate decarboxylase family protein [Mycobacteriales bacterium]